ncbi:25-hydroxycholesterol 7-alpha-hydroxylase [Paramyrothecium foliicola]|nr:25-hydroxycholesterol 7-alpha-hydroxylase [Paramyrothecium foliicola]
MSQSAAVIIGGLVIFYVSLRLLLRVTHDAKEPPAIVTAIPFLSPLVGMIREKSSLYLRLRDEYRLPIYTLRLPFARIYVVNATELIAPLQKHWRHVSFAVIAADAGGAVGMSKGALEVMHRDITSEEGFTLSWPRYIMPAMSPGEDLDLLNRRAIEVFATKTEELRDQGHQKISLWHWTRRAMVDSTTEAVWGPENPYKDEAITEAWKTFEAGFLTLTMFPMSSFFFPKIHRARELVAAALIEYMRKGGHRQASGLVRRRYEHHVQQFGLSLEDFARGELGNTFAVLGNSAPCALWLLYHIYSNEKVLEDVRREASALVRENGEDGVSSIDLVGIRTFCPILQSTFQETLRHRSVNPGPRVLLEDVVLDEGILLKKGSMLMVPAPVQHTSTAAWGEDANEFHHLRFVRKLEPGQKKPNRVAFRAFGGGHVLCPGRYFATTEIMALAALMVLQFDLLPATGHWTEPTWKNSPLQAGFPIPDQDVVVEVRPRGPTRKWHVAFSGSAEAIKIVSEDIGE